eukprot:3982100-Alexandrium_andersonii.AAC.1
MSGCATSSRQGQARGLCYGAYQVREELAGSFQHTRECCVASFLGGHASARCVSCLAEACLSRKPIFAKRCQPAGACLG